jgi:16S rRNA (guanine527-N7)-methyltransferase
LVVPEQSSRRERGLRKDPGAKPAGGEARNPSSLPRQTSARRPLPDTAYGLPALGDEFWAIVDEGMVRLDAHLTPGARAAIEAQAKLLLAWNPFINLTALRSVDQIARGHVLDSLSAVHLLRRLGGSRLLDVGSGAGYPGLPLAVALPATDAALVDSVGKKQAFLQVAARAAMAAVAAHGEQPPQVVALAERVENLAEDADHREAWDVLVARAVGSLAEVVELSLPLLVSGGHLVAWKRRSPDGALDRELSVARRVLQAVGGGRPQVEQIGGLQQAGPAEHVLVVVRKVRPTPDRYPRPPSERRRALLP